jgi:hypothetical protein
MSKKRNAPALAKREGVGCMLGGYIDAYATEALLLQQIRSQLPILTLHMGLDGLASFGEAQHG